ncbi:MAG TPA: hypothetical protein VFC78_09760 [Tepidisphaeraceae bacterium]|nr:hypothetical protein [Tepidisphaeraceae bacterium]
MQKYVAILERNVQWIAIALGALYLGYNVWAYVWSSPLQIEMAPGTVATPGTADKVIAEGPAWQLKKQINDKFTQSVEVPSVIEKYVARLDEKQQAFALLNIPWAATIYDFKPPTGKEITVPVTIVALPHPMPGAMPIAVSSGMTVIESPAPAGAGAPAAALPVGLAGAGAQAALLRKDVNYNSVTAKIDVAALAKAFNQAYGKPGALPDWMYTGFVQVELLREERQANGQWTAPTVVPALPIYTMMPFPDAKTAGVKEYVEYKSWVEGNQPLLTQPAFYQTAPDAPPWEFPVANAPVNAGPAAGESAGQPRRIFNPATDTPQNEQERGQLQYYQNQQMAAQRRAAMAAGRGGYGHGLGRGGPPIRGGGYPGRGGYPRPPLPPPGIGNPFARPVPIGPPRANMQGFGQVALAGFFNPNTLPQDINLLAHDTDVQEGKTYRYAFRYKLYNPVYQVSAQMIDPKIRDEFAISGPDPLKDPQLWTKPVSIEQHTHLYATNITVNATQSQATFDLFMWKDGRWHENTTTRLTPGDLITAAGGKEAITGWTVVDVRKDPVKTTENYVIVMDDKGVLQRRDVQSDQNNAEYQKLKAEAGAAAAAQ